MGKLKKILAMSIPLFMVLFLLPVQSAHGEVLNVEKLVLFKNHVNKTLIEDLGGTILEEYKNIPALRVSIPETTLSNLKQNISIKSIENEQKVALTGQVQDWGVNAVKAPLAWHSNYTGKNVKVAVIDSGIFPHEDLHIAGGKSFVPYTTSYADDEGHGTHVAGIIAAKNNDIGIVGVAPDAQLYALKVLDSSGTGDLTNVLAAIDWAISNKMDIINLSLGSMDPSPTLQTALKKASDSGILVVAAAGNSGTPDGTGDTVAYPARYDSVIAVAATDSNNNRASFSATGNEVDFAAPGINIISTVLNNQYASYSGTSMATAFVTGDLALLKEMYPTMSNTELIDQLKRKALDLGIPGHDSFYGNGLIQSPLSPERLAGADRFEVAVNVSRKGWQSSNTVFISNYLAFADALSAGPLAYKYNAPILLTAPSSLNALTKQEIARLGAKNAIIIGGKGSVNETVASQLRSMGISVQRIDGLDRFEVSRNIANKMGAVHTAVIANGLNFPDALSIAPYASTKGYPILLTRPTELPGEISGFLKDTAVSNTIIVGGEASVSPNVASAVPAPDRIGGKDRYEVAKNIFEKFYPNTDKLYIATGATFADALTGSVLISKDHTALLLTTKDTIPSSTLQALSSRSIQNYVVLGGVGSVGNNVLSSLDK